MNAQPLRLKMAALVLAGLSASGCTGGDTANPARTSGEPSGVDTVAPAVLVNSDLSGKAWRPLRKYVPRAWRHQTPPSTGSIKFMSDGTWTGFDGCNGLQGKYRLLDSRLIFLTESFNTDIGCANMSPKDGLGGALITLNANATLLTAMDADGEVLVEYRR